MALSLQKKEALSFDRATKLLNQSYDYLDKKKQHYEKLTDDEVTTLCYHVNSDEKQSPEALELREGEIWVKWPLKTIINDNIYKKLDYQHRPYAIYERAKLGVKNDSSPREPNNMMNSPYTLLKDKHSFSVKSRNLKGNGQPVQGEVGNNVKYVKWNKSGNCGLFFKFCCCCYDYENYVKKQYPPDGEFSPNDILNRVSLINEYYRGEFDQDIAYYIREYTILVKRFYGDHGIGEVKSGYILLDTNDQNFVGRRVVDFDYLYRLDDHIDQCGQDYLNKRLSWHEHMTNRAYMPNGGDQQLVDKIYLSYLKDQNYTEQMDEVINFLSKWRKCSNPNELKQRVLEESKMISDDSDDHEYDGSESDSQEEQQANNTSSCCIL